MKKIVIAVIIILTLATLALANDLTTFRVATTPTEEVKGFGFTLQYNAEKYEFVSAEQASADPAMLIVSSGETGQVFVGSMSEGDIAFTFQTLYPSAEGDFLIADGVAVNLNGVRIIPSMEIVGLETPISDYTLLQNFPNPFNPSTAIQYMLPRADEVELVIYNLLGQEVSRLVHELRDAGTHTVMWDGTNNLGKQVASGVYIYRMVASDFVSVNRMVLLR